MRESIILIKEIEILTANKTEYKEEKKRKVVLNEAQKEGKEEEQIEESEFYEKMRKIKNDTEIEKLVNRTNFKTSLLASYQEQLKYLQ